MPHLRRWHLRHCSLPYPTARHHSCLRSFGLLFKRRSHVKDGRDEPRARFPWRRLPAAEVYPGSNLASAEYLAGSKDLPLPLRPLARREFTQIDFARVNITRSAVPAVPARGGALPAANYG